MLENILHDPIIILLYTSFKYNFNSYELIKIMHQQTLLAFTHTLQTKTPVLYYYFC